MNPNKPNNISEYISGFPKETQLLLEQVRATIKKAVPNAVEVISYGMPAFKMNGVLVYFAAYKNHIGFYPTASGIKAFKEEISGFKNSKGAVQFPVDKPLPLELITRITEFRVIEDLRKNPTKKK